MNGEATVPLIVVEGPHAQFRYAVDEVRAAGWSVHIGGADDGRGASAGAVAGRAATGAATPIVVSSTVASTADAAEIVAAVLAGAGAVVHGVGPRVVLAALCDDLRHLGALDHRVGASRVLLDAEERQLLDALVDGRTVADVAREHYLSRRTVERRLASLRVRFEVASPVELLAAYRAQRESVPRPQQRATPGSLA